MSKITIDRSVVEQALEVFKHGGLWKQQQVMAALRAALEQPRVEHEPAIYPEEAFDMGLEAIPYYAHPQPPRQPLTLEQIAEIGQTYTDETWRDDGWSTDFARAIEAAHGIKEQK